MAECPIQLVSHSPAWSADQNGWISIQRVSCFPLFKQIHPLITPIQDVSCSPVFMQIRSTASDQTAEHPFREWVTLHCLSRLDLDQNGWTPVQGVSHSPLFEIHWPERLNTHLGCELFEHWQIKSTDQNGWTPIQQVSYSLLFEQIH